MKKTLKRLLCLGLALLLALGCAAPASATGEKIYTLEVPVSYRQTEAHKLLAMVNEFRTGADAWYYAPDGSRVELIGQLQPLQYSAALEEIAMQRAAEIAVSFAHQRPNGGSCFTAEAADGTMTFGENIAAGSYTMTTAQEAHTAWREDNFGYDGQGHRRAMLQKGYTAIGVACVSYQSGTFWVEEFGYAEDGPGQAQDGERSVAVELAESFVSSAADLKLSAEELTLTEGRSAELPTATASVSVKNAWRTTAPPLTVQPDWSSADESVAAVNKGLVTAKAAGVTVLSAELFGQSLSLRITVTAEEPEPTPEPVHPDGWAEEDGSTCYYQNGERISGWLQEGDFWYFFDERGAMVSSCWLGSYYFHADGRMAADEWIDGWYVGPDGLWVPLGWQQGSGGWWYAEQDGSWPADCWRQIDGVWYRFDASGYMLTGWYAEGETWYYLLPGGAMAQGWTQIEGDWYYFYEGGAMATGWLPVDGHWYYCYDSGVMATGWIYDGQWYWLNEYGALA